MIGKTKWYLGGSLYGITVNNYYVSERSNTVYEGRSINWLGDIGLIYPSDYGYATSENNCLSTIMNTYGTSCAKKNWLHKEINYWTITSGSTYSSYVFRVFLTGNVNYDAATDNPSGVRPNIYLKSSIKISSGDGSERNPYILAQ